MLTSSSVSLAMIRAAAARIAPYLFPTPLERSRAREARTGAMVLLKQEAFQVTGSFKARGALARLTALTPDERAAGVLAVSAGNHGQAVAYGAEALGLDAVVVVPESASRAKVEAIRRYPVTLLERGADYTEAEQLAIRMARESGRTFVSPYNDPEVIAGQGTIALEMLAADPDLEVLIAPVSGGGLLAGVAAAAKAIKPSIRVIGVEPAASPTMTHALKMGRIEAIAEEATLADGLAGNIEPGAITFPIIQALVDEVVLVSEDAIRAAMREAAEVDHQMLEGSAAVTLAALGQLELAGKRVGVVVSGRNITLETFLGAIAP